MHMQEGETGSLLGRALLQSKTATHILPNVCEENHCKAGERGQYQEGSKEGLVFAINH